MKDIEGALKCFPHPESVTYTGELPRGYKELFEYLRRQIYYEE